MNIFKVIASSNKSFREETASAVLLWLLNPSMDHGLDHVFLKKFIQQVADSVDSKELQTESENLKIYFRGENDSESNISFNLEYDVGSAFIDIVLFFDNWVIAIENKIYLQSATDGQLQREYDGLIKDLQESENNDELSEVPPVTMIYLVPYFESSMDGKIPAKLQNEYDSFKKRKDRKDDSLQRVTWQKNNIGVPSIFSMIENILKDEMNGNIDPIPAYTKDTLKALKVFISNDFQGYTYESNTSTGGLNPLTEDTLNVEDIRKNKSMSYVGVKGGVNGLLKIPKNKIDDKNRKYQCTSQNMDKKRWWMKREMFLNIVDWRVSGNINPINWDDLKFGAEMIYTIAKDYPSIYIGIQGGESGLERLNPDVIRNKSWQISSTKRNNQWIEADTYVDIIDSKNLF